MSNQKKGYLCREEQIFWEKERKVAAARDSIRDLVIDGLSHHRRVRCFEGWYYKHQKGDTVLAFMPGQSIDKKGKRHPFLQVIWNEHAYWFGYDKEDYLVDRRQGRVIIGNNTFSRRGVNINVHSKNLTIQGSLHYGTLRPLIYSIMGPFEYIPCMECKHEIFSMTHPLQGKIKINEKVLHFQGGKGYIEGDRGKSFPSNYMWLQCNQFKEDAAIMISIARIPFMGFHFQGCICVILYKGKEYRFTTYLGGKVVSKRKSEIVLKQGNYCLKVCLSKQQGKKSPKFSHKLLAPEKGIMKRYIKEEHLLFGRFILYHKEKQIFDLSSRYVSYEYEDKGKKR